MSSQTSYYTGILIPILKYSYSVYSVHHYHHYFTAHYSLHISVHCSLLAGQEKSESLQVHTHLQTISSRTATGTGGPHIQSNIQTFIFLYLL